MANTPSAGYDASAAASAAFDFKLYRYTPSLPAAIVFAVVFGVLAALHTWRLLRHRAYYFATFTVGGYFQLVGYCGRIWSHFDPLSIGGFVIQAILILVAPALYAASIYMILGRLIRTLQADSHSLLPIAWATKIFVFSDVLSFTLQAGGGGIQAAGTLELYEIGEKVIIAGLFVQIVMFGFFIATAVLFHMRYARGQWRPAAGGEDVNCGQACNKTKVQWRRHLWVLYAVSALILVRSIFRVIEYLQGNRGYLIAHEVFLYVFDGALMVLVMAIFLVWYVDDLDATEGHRGDSDYTLSEIQG